MASPSSTELEAMGVLDEDHVFAAGHHDNTDTSIETEESTNIVARIEELKRLLKEKRASSVEYKSRTAEAVARAKDLLKERDAIRTERIAAEKQNKDADLNVYHSSWYTKHCESHANAQNNHVEARLPKSPWK